LQVCTHSPSGTPGSNKYSEEWSDQEIVLIDQRSWYVSLCRGVRNGGKGPKIIFDEVLRDRWITLTKICRGIIYVLMQQILAMENPLLPQDELDAKIKSLTRMGPREKNASVYNNAKKLIRSALGLEHLGHAKVNVLLWYI
jgi:hypothetical protein